MNVKQLKAIMKELPDDMVVGGSGHYGELLEVNYVHVTGVRNDVFGGRANAQTILCIDIEDAGEEPD